MADYSDTNYYEVQIDDIAAGGGYGDLQEYLSDMAALANEALGNAERAEAAAEDAETSKEFLEDLKNGIEPAVDAWLDEHPEATTTVQDGSITPSKFAHNAISVDTWSGSSSINNWSGDTLEEKLCDFLENATNGAKLDLQGAKITITERFVKSQYTFLNNTVISNGIFEIPESIGGWLSIGSSGGYRVPIFNNCVFTGGGAIFYDQSYNFKAIGCIFYDVQILNGDYIQACELVGCNIMNRNHYLIECNWAFGVTMTQCTFEAGNVGVFKGNGNARYASLTSGSFNACTFEGFTDAVFRTNGITAVNFNSCYIELVPYLIYDSKQYKDVFYVSINGGFIDNRAGENTYTIYSNATYPSLLVNNLHFNGSTTRYLSNFTNYRKQIVTGNLGSQYLYGANDGKNEIIQNKFIFSGTNFSFSTNRTSIYTQPQAFLVIIAGYSSTPVLFTRISILTLNYRPSTGYTVTETPIVPNSSMGATITWTAEADDILGMVTITGQSTEAISLSVVNLGTVMNGMII